MGYFPSSRKRPWKPARPKHERKHNNPFYHSPEWRKARRSYIADHPLCEWCKKKGKTVPGTTVDHKRRINPYDAYDTQDGRYGEPLDSANFQTLCDRCHAIKSGRERHQKN